ncbi:hypothetical protein BC827DRAFT_1155250 [Russula dissimulans]|nr:hypothetical protein BC827DRAFT_1155250 [Russula dissimulans]
MPVTYWLQMGALAAENTQLKLDLETAQKESATITEEQWSMMPSKLPPLLHLPTSYLLKRLNKKKTWKKPPEVSETKVSQEQWEAEKAELVKSRDEAVTQAKKHTYDDSVGHTRGDGEAQRGAGMARQAKPSQGQAPIDGFGLAWSFTKPKPPQAKPKPGLLG